MTQTSREYAVALFTLAKESDSEKQIAQSLDFVEGILKENPEYVEFLQTPSIPKRERVNAAQELLENRVHEYVLSFVCLLIEKGLIKTFESCVYEYKTLYNTVANVSTAEVFSVVPLNDREKNELTQKLKSICNHDVVLDCNIDESILGGIVVKMDGKVYDGSVKQYLNDVKEVMYE